MCVCPICVDKKFRIRYEKKRVFECDTFSKFILSSCLLLSVSLCALVVVLFGFLLCFSLSLLFVKNETPRKKNNKIFLLKKKNVDDALLLRKVFLCCCSHVVVVVVVVVEEWSEEEVDEIVDIDNFFLPRRRTTQIIDFDYENDELANGRRRRRE